MVQQGTFRADLYYRLRYLSVVVPAVRDRGDDWELIASYFLNHLRTKHRTDKRLSDESRETMRACGWPGNSRAQPPRASARSVVGLTRGEMLERLTCRCYVVR